MPQGLSSTRRDFVRMSAVAGTGILVAGLSGDAIAEEQAREKDPKKGATAADEGVSPPEDLMREHGVLKRLLLVCGESVRRIESKQDLPVDALQNAAQLV